MKRLSWAWAPVIGIGLAALANAVAIPLWIRARAEAVEDRPYLASARFDEHKAALARFVDRGLALRTEPRPAGLRLVLAGGTLTDGTLTLYRPDDRALDRLIAWDGAQALDLDLKPGPWRVLVQGTLADAAVAAEATVRIPSG